MVPPLLCFSVFLFLAGAPALSANQPVAAVFLDEDDSALAREIGGDIQGAGYAVEFIGSPALTNSAALLGRNFDLLVLPDAQHLPAGLMQPVHDYLRGGGRMMAMGLPAWESPTFNFSGKTYSKQDYQGLIDAQIPDHAIIDFGRQDPGHWQRNLEGANTKTVVEATEDNGKPAVHVIIDNLGGWDVLVGPRLTNSFPDGRTLTCFRARGTADTRELSLEWQEEDGSRWIATVDLAPEWKSYCLPPKAFHFWESTPGRGGAGDRFNVRHAARICVGLARSHGGYTGTHQEYWIGNIGAARFPFADAPAPEEVHSPKLDTLSPGWKFFPIHGAISLTAPAGLALVDSLRLPMTTDSNALPQGIQPRPGGAGFNQERPWRWQPLLEARSKAGEYRGAVATLMAHFDGEFRNGIWASFTPGGLEFYRQEPVRRLIRQTASAMRRGLFLAEGGSEFFTVFDKQEFSLGGRVVNMGKAGQGNLTLRISVKAKIGGKKAFAREWPMDLAAGETRAAWEQWQPARWPEGGFIVTTELLQNGKIIDRLKNELNVWQPKQKPEFITERDGGFRWRGRPWKANGVNYMPATGIGVTSGDYFEHWLGRGAYDPGAEERDLERINGMHFNAVSIFIDYSSLRAQNLLDFLRRCDALGLHVNLSLRPGTPIDFQWDKMKALIGYYRMAENDTIFAYDLAWEAEHVDEQNSYGRDWTDWANRRYGNIGLAEKKWGGFPHFLEGAKTLAVPPLTELAHDGPWRVFVADYRAFLDDELTWKYGEARRLVRSIDPHHAVSFRMSEAGDPTLNSDRRLPYDFYGLAKAVDIWEPEAYGRIGPWDKVKPGRFELDYARLCDPTKPVMWAEMGYSVWDERHEYAAPEKLEFQAGFYRDFYRMMEQSGCDGVFFWWYAGGFRADEKSDFGIINPDGTDRPVTGVIREEGPGFLKAAKQQPPDYFIPIDRDRDARGLFGIYDSVQSNYWQAIADGKTPALRWARKPGQ